MKTLFDEKPLRRETGAQRRISIEVGTQGTGNRREIYRGTSWSKKGRSASGSEKTASSSSRKHSRDGESAEDEKEQVQKKEREIVRLSDRQTRQGPALEVEGQWRVELVRRLGCVGALEEDE